MPSRTNATPEKVNICCGISVQLMIATCILKFDGFFFFVVVTTPFHLRRPRFGFQNGNETTAYVGTA